MTMLDKVKVVSLTHYLQGPACVQILADLGADVVKIERPGGAYERYWSGAQSEVDGESTFYMLTGRNQQSVELDFRTEAGGAILRRLISEADVLVENYRPGVLSKYGFGPEDATEINPSLIYCSLSGYGSSGPRASEPGQDLLIQALSGMMMLSGRHDDPPMPVGTALVDQHSAVLGSLGVLAALFRRERTGRGCRVDANLLSSALDLQIEPLNYHLNGTELYPRSRSGVSSRFHQAPYGVFATSDGWITLSLASAQVLSEALNQPALADWTSEDQFLRREEVNDQVAEALQRKTTTEWLETLTQHKVWCAPVQDYEQIIQDPQVVANDSFVEFEGRAGTPVKVLGHPIRYDDERPALRRRPPEAGADTATVLRALGYSPNEIDDLTTQGVIGAGWREHADSDNNL